ncbi:MAG TPA: hypothetical protein VKP30_06410 [Polyangiaceae bacterium]|nr:hypothetical protein [Polyangiaceae bacterium]
MISLTQVEYGLADSRQGKRRRERSYQSVSAATISPLFDVVRFALDPGTPMEPRFVER